MFVLLTLLLTGCTGADKVSPKSKITIEPYRMSEQEDLLISHTDMSNIEFFKLNGTLAEQEDIQISVVVYEQGSFKEELLVTSRNTERNYKDSLISFGISGLGDEDRPLKLMAGFDDGLVSTSYSMTMLPSFLGSSIEKKIFLQKNKPVYLAEWLGTSKNGLLSMGIEEGKLPSGIKKAELAFVYKVLWMDKEES